MDVTAPAAVVSPFRSNAVTVGTRLESPSLLAVNREMAPEGDSDFLLYRSRTTVPSSSRLSAKAGKSASVVNCLLYFPSTSLFFLINNIFKHPTSNNNTTNQHPTIHFPSSTASIRQHHHPEKSISTMFPIVIVTALAAVAMAQTTITSSVSSTLSMPPEAHTTVKAYLPDVIDRMHLTGSVQYAMPCGQTTMAVHGCSQRDGHYRAKEYCSALAEAGMSPAEVSRSLNTPGLLLTRFAGHHDHWTLEYRASVFLDFSRWSQQTRSRGERHRNMQDITRQEEPQGRKGRVQRSCHPFCQPQESQDNQTRMSPASCCLPSSITDTKQPNFNKKNFDLHELTITAGASNLATATCNL